MRTRPVRVTIYRQRISADRSIPVVHMAYADGHVIDRMSLVGQLSDRQYTAACRLYGLFLAAGLLPRLVPRQDTASVELEFDDTAGGSMPTEEARIVYRRLLRDAGQIQGPALDALMHDQHPGVRWLAVVQQALDDLAIGWGMDSNSA